MEEFKSRRERKAEPLKSITPSSSKDQKWFTKRPVIIGAIIAVVIIVVAVFSLVVSLLISTQYNGTAKVQKDSKKHYEIVIKKSASQVQKDRATQLKTWQASLKNTNCSSLISFPWLAKGKERCEQQNRSMKAVKEALSLAQTLLEYDMQVKAVIAPLVTTAEVTNFVAEAEKWQLATKQLEGVKVPSGVGDTHAQLIARTKRVGEVWVQLQAANTAEKPGEFRESEKALPSAYADFRTSQADLAGVYVKAQNALQEAAGNYY